MTTKKKDNRGGRREGAGRPKSKEGAKVVVSARIDKELNDVFNSEEFKKKASKSDYVNTAIREAMLRDGYIGATNNEGV